jgi:hypothetical protein
MTATIAGRVTTHGMRVKVWSSSMNKTEIETPDQARSSLQTAGLLPGALSAGGRLHTHHTH